MTVLRIFDIPWALFPVQLLGIENVLAHVPLSLAVFLIGAIPAVFIPVTDGLYLY